MPLFPGLQERAAGVLLHPTSLPSPFGVGNLGEEARAFVDFLADSGATWWQVCPLGPTGFGDSPYACFSAFAGNPYLIDPRPLVAAGLLADADLAPLRALSKERVEYGFLWEHFFPVMAKAWATAKATPAALKRLGDFEKFRREEASWLDGYALFMALKHRHGGKPWYEWPSEDKHYARARLTRPDADLADDIEEQKFLQFLFFTQWRELREYAAKSGVKILGDAPIYVALDSAEVWTRPDLFELDRTLKPAFVAGVPPDYFSATGQLWGNPLYDWKANKGEDYAWWISRLKANLAMTDALRIDHFRAFHDYWKIPAGAPDARPGKWAKGPGLDFFKAVAKALPDAELVAEDLGDLSPGVHKLLSETGLPGMAILQFAFGGPAANPYLPHNHAPNAVVYPGTHDNDTAAGWYAATDDKTRDHFRIYFGTDGSSPSWTLLRACYTSPARLAVIPAQDLLGLGAEARFNTPGTAEGNWSWRLTAERLVELRTFIAPNLRALAEATGRVRPKSSPAAE